MLQDLQQSLTPPMTFKTEESLIFRILVQSLVIVGIIATDVAARTYMSLWAIPLSIIGAAWSWHHRKDKNISMKFLLAIGMIGVLFLFLNKLVTNLGDTRLVLAELLVQLQVLHSFDLPRRKDLGYSMVIGLILLGVAGTISQTMLFAPWLLLFLAIALPTLILDYRSRLGFDPIDLELKRKKTNVSLSQSTKKWKIADYSPLPPKQLGIFLFVTLTLGLIVFISLPRVPGYQLQTFPVSSPVESENQRFDEENRAITNPGYAQEGEGQGQGGSSDGRSPIKGKGQVDQTHYYGFNPTMNQNLRGEMKPQVVLRVRSQAPGFWKVMSFDHYTGQGWEITDKNELTELENVWSNYRFHLPNIATIARRKRIVQTYTAVSFLPNVIPALDHPRLVFFPAKQIAMDKEGSLRAPLGLLKGLTYTVISFVPYRDATALSKAKGGYPKIVEERYFEIPPEIKQRVREKTLELLAKAPIPVTSDYAKTAYLAQQLKTQYEIQPDFPFLEEDEDLVESFLFKHGGGYPDHFSTVLTVMLRSIDIPARLTTGFGPGKFNPFTGFYIVRNTDAYALTEVYFPNYGWYSFDPIPEHELIPPSFTEYETFGVVRQFWNLIAGFLPPPVTEFVAFVWSKLIQGLFSMIGAIWSMISGSILGMMLGIIGAICLGFLGWIAWLKVKTWGWYRRVAKLPPVAQIYQQMLRLMNQNGSPKHPAQTPLEYVAICRKSQSPEIAEIIETISQGYVQWRYGQVEQNTDYLQQQLQGLKRGLSRKSNRNVKSV